MGVSVRTVYQFCFALLLGAGVPGVASVCGEEISAGKGRTIVGTVQNQDLRRVGQAIVEVKDQEGTSWARPWPTTQENLPSISHPRGPIP